jgi:hypothetical protein
MALRSPGGDEYVFGANLEHQEQLERTGDAGFGARRSANVPLLAQLTQIAAQLAANAATDDQKQQQQLADARTGQAKAEATAAAALSEQKRLEQQAKAAETNQQTQLKQLQGSLQKSHRQALSEQQTRLEQQATAESQAAATRAEEAATQAETKLADKTQQLVKEQAEHVAKLAAADAAHTVEKRNSESARQLLLISKKETADALARTTVQHQPEMAWLGHVLQQADLGHMVSLVRAGAATHHLEKAIRDHLTGSKTVILGLFLASLASDTAIHLVGSAGRSMLSALIDTARGDSGGNVEGLSSVLVQAAKQYGPHRAGLYFAIERKGIRPDKNLVVAADAGDRRGRRNFAVQAEGGEQMLEESTVIATECDGAKHNTCTVASSAQGLTDIIGKDWGTGSPMRARIVYRQDLLKWLAGLMCARDCKDTVIWRGARGIVGGVQVGGWGPANGTMTSSGGKPWSLNAIGYSYCKPVVAIRGWAGILAESAPLVMAAEQLPLENRFPISPNGGRLMTYRPTGLDDAQWEACKAEQSHSISHLTGVHVSASEDAVRGCAYALVVTDGKVSALKLLQKSEELPSELPQSSHRGVTWDAARGKWKVAINPQNGKKSQFGLHNISTVRSPSYWVYKSTHEQFGRVRGFHRRPAGGKEESV